MYLRIKIITGNSFEIIFNIFSICCFQMPIKTQNPYDFNDDWMSKIWRKLGIRGIPKHVINQI